MIIQEYMTPWAERPALRIRKPIVQITRSTLGMIIVFRSPFSRAWLFNITMAMGAI